MLGFHQYARPARFLTVVMIPNIAKDVSSYNRLSSLRSTYNQALTNRLKLRNASFSSLDMQPYSQIEHGLKNVVLHIFHHMPSNAEVIGDTVNGYARSIHAL